MKKLIHILFAGGAIFFTSCTHTSHSQIGILQKDDKKIPIREMSYKYHEKEACVFYLDKNNNKKYDGKIDMVIAASFGNCNDIKIDSKMKIIQDRYIRFQ